MSLSCPWALHCRRCPWQHLWPAWRGLLCLRSRERRGEEMTSQTTNDLSCLRCFALQHFMYLNRLLEHRYLFVRRLVGDLLGNLRPRPASSSPQSGGSSSNNNSTSPLSIFPWVADWVAPPPLPPSPSSPSLGSEASHLRMPSDSNSSGTGEERASSQEASTSASSRSEPAKPISANARASAAVAAMYDASSPARAGSSAAARGGGTRRERGPSVNYSGGWWL